MPERHVSKLEEELVSNWLWRQRERGVIVKNVEHRWEGSVVFDNYELGEGFINFRVDMADRSGLNEVDCDEDTYRILEHIKIFPRESQSDVQTS